MSQILHVQIGPGAQLLSCAANGARAMGKDLGTYASCNASMFQAGPWNGCQSVLLQPSEKSHALWSQRLWTYSPEPR
jgi:hypothetical protein